MDGPGPAAGPRPQSEGGDRRGSVARLLQAWRPEIEIRSLTYLGEGDFCRAYLLNGHRVVRIPRHEEAAGALAREACLLTDLAPRLAATVPRPTHVSRPFPAGSSFSVHELLPGLPLTRARWRSLPEAVRTRLAGDVGRFLGQLHAIDAGIGRPCGVGEVDHRARVDQLRERLREAPSPLPGTLRSELDVHFGRYLSGDAGWRYEPALLHADVSPGHVLVDTERGEITGIIDWGDAVVGDPARDFIFLYEDWGGDFLDPALEAYGLEGKDRLLPRVYLMYLADQLAWTLGAGEGGRKQDLEEGIAALHGAVRDLGKSAAGRSPHGRPGAGPLSSSGLGDTLRPS